MHTTTGGLNAAQTALEPHTNTDGINGEGSPAYDETWHNESSDSGIDEWRRYQYTGKYCGELTSPPLYDGKELSAWLLKVMAKDVPPTPAAEAVVDADTGELIPREIDGFVIPQRAKDGYVNATAMCKAAGKEFSNYWQNARTKMFMDVLERFLGIPRHLLAESITNGPNTNRGSWVHPRVAINIAQWCSPEFDVAVSGWVEEWLTTGKTPTAPAFHLPTTFAEALRLAADATEANEQLKLENRQLGADLDATTHELGVAVTEKQEEERKAAAIARAVSIEAESKILTGWLKEVQAITGVGPRTATKILQAYGILCRHKVEGCSNTDEPGISTQYLNNEWLCYKLQPAVGKTIAEDKLDEDGEQTSVHSRTVKITPKGCPLIMNLLSTCNETLLCRLINLMKIKELQILRGRYTFAEKHNFAHKLFPKSEDTVRKIIRFIEPKDSETGRWEVWTYWSSKGSVTVRGSGDTLEQAFLRLASYVEGLGPYVSGE